MLNLSQNSPSSVASQSLVCCLPVLMLFWHFWPYVGWYSGLVSKRTCHPANLVKSSTKRTWNKENSAELYLSLSSTLYQWLFSFIVDKGSGFGARKNKQLTIDDDDSQGKLIQRLFMFLSTLEKLTGKEKSVELNAAK